MLAESLHSIADSGNQLLLIIGRNRAKREETEEHQFGFGAERYFYAFIVALVLFTVGAVFSGYEGIERIRHPGHLTSPVVAIVVLVIAMSLEGFSLRTAVVESNRVRGRAAWRSFIRHAKAPELPTVLLEDVAALTGLTLALLGVVIAWLTGNDRWDGVGSLAIGVLLACVAVVLATEMKSLLIGESASRQAEAAIVEAIESQPEVVRVIHLRTLHIGPDTLLVAAKIGVRHDDTAASVAAAIDAVERRIRAAVPIAELIFLEPDIYQSARVDVADPAIKAARRWSPRGRSPRAARRGRPLHGRQLRGQQRREPPGIAQLGQVGVASGVGPDVGIAGDRLGDSVGRRVQLPSPGLGTGEVIARHAARRIGRVEGGCARYCAGG